ncbi:MAG: selenocysteine-specific translation elongation factor [Planctomycetota bacterium]|nr:selenocysteine-specific translation elongation factor [Planctomycetota bacterium]
MSDERKLSRFVLGTAGHIDHGKSTLIKALTGIDPDRLAEEKKRGLTIDIGFAHVELSEHRVVGFIDVPGHEKFIKNMVAGATAIHGVILVVAADDSVMQQTREHLSILKYLEIPDGLVVITKSDMVDEETIEIVRMDVAEAVKGTFLEDKPVVTVSALKGHGMDEFRTELNALCERVPEIPSRGIFRYPVHRSFSQSGFGTVLTGVPVSGELSVGDEVQLMPGGKSGRARGMQAYHQSVDTVYAGHCAALNISDIKKDEVERGMVACSPGYCRSVTNLEVRFTYTPLDTERPLKDYSDITFHAGSAELPAKLAFLGGAKAVRPEQAVFAQVRLEKPVVVWPGMRYVVRRLSPPETLGGGVVLGASDRRLRRNAQSTIQMLERRLSALGDHSALCEVLLEEAGLATVELKRFCIECGLLPQEMQPVLDELVNTENALKVGDKYVSAAELEKGCRDILDAMSGLHKEEPYVVYHEKVALREAGPKEDRLFDLCLDMLKSRGELEFSEGTVRQSGYSPPLSEVDRKVIARLEKWFSDSPLETHSIHSASQDMGIKISELERLYSILVQTGRIVELPDGVYLSSDDMDFARQKLEEHFEENETLRSADFKTKIGAARKVTFALLDYFEKTGLTFRKGNEHQLRRY